MNIANCSRGVPSCELRSNRSPTLTVPTFSGRKLFPVSLLFATPCSGPITRPFPFDDHPPARESSPPHLLAFIFFLLQLQEPSLACIPLAPPASFSPLRLGASPESSTVACSSCPCCLACRLYGHHLICSDFEYNHHRGWSQCSAAVTREVSSSVSSRRHGFLMRGSAWE